MSSFPLGTFEGIGTLGTPGSYIVSFQLFARIISITISVLTICGGLWFIGQIFQGSFTWLTSGGDKQALENAKKRLQHAIIGLLMVVLSYAFISLIGYILGFPTILSPAKSLGAVPDAPINTGH